MDTTTERFGLQRPPFAIQGARDAVLATRPLKRAQSAIESALSSRTTQIWVSGAQGCGKTSLVRALTRSLGHHASVAGVAVLDASDWPALRTSIARQLGLRAGQLSRGSLAKARRTGRRWVLIADEADRLSAEVLDQLDILLDNADADGEPFFSFIALGSAAPVAASAGSFRGWLDPQRTVHVELESLDAEGVHGYIEKRLRVAGRVGRWLFSSAAAAEVHRATAGNPRAVNAVCRSLLSEAGRHDLSAVGADLVRAICPAGVAPSLACSPAPELAEPALLGGRSSAAWPTLWALALVAMLSLVSFAAAAPPAG